MPRGDSPSSGRDALIVGAGVGGLTAALVLARHGWRVAVIEQADEIAPVGAGIQLSPNASRVFLSLGLEQALDGAAFRPEAIEMRQWRTGTPVLKSELGERVARRYGAPYLHIHRADLHGVLLDATRRDRRIALETGARCIGVEQESSGASAVLADGTRRSGALLLGADGIKSVVRHALLGADAPRFAGCVAWRGVIPSGRIGGSEIPPRVVNWMGPAAHFVHYYVRGGAALNFIAVEETGAWSDESWTARGDKDDLAQRFAGWHPMVRAVIAAADERQCYKWALFDRFPLTQWSRGCVSLLGDACHPTLPFAAQGACMAIEDAAVLGRCLADTSDVPAALQRYEAARRPRTAMIQRLSRRNQVLYHLRDGTGWLRDAGGPVLSLMLARVTDSIFRYDALTVPLP